MASPAAALIARAELAAGRLSALTPPRLERLLAGKPIELDGQTLHPQAQSVLRLQELLRLDRDPADIDAWRRKLEHEVRLVYGKRIEVGAVSELTVAGAEGPLAARLYTPAGAPSSGPLLIFFHGGGFAVGTLDSHDQPCRLLCREAGTRVLSVAYRLGPEHRFPAALDDGLAAFNAVVAEPGRFGGAAGEIAVGGDSAGGNLATGVARLARDAGGEQPAYQALIYPVCDYSRKARSRELFGEGFYLTERRLEWWGDCYFDPEQASDPGVSPLLAEDLSGMAPARILVCGFDPLRDECFAYAGRLRDAGVDVSVTFAPDLIHAFINMVGAGGRFREQLAEYAETLSA